MHDEAGTEEATGASGGAPPATDKAWICDMTPPTDTAPPERLPARKKAAFLTVLLALSTAGVFIPFEMLVRHQETMEVIPLVRDNPHGSGSHRNKPNLQFTGLVKGHKIRIQTNPQGMHWYPVSNVSTSGLDRVAFVGDSFTFGCWADDFRCGLVGVFDGLVKSRGYEALNFGVEGYGLDDIELILKEEVFNFHPTVVVLMFFNGNDFADTYLGLDKYDIRDGTCRSKKELIEARLPPGARPRERGNDTSRPVGAIKAWLTKHSAVARRASRLMREMGAGRETGTTPTSTSFAVDPDFTSFAYWSQVPYPPLAVEAREISLAALERIHTFVQQRGARLVIASIPYAKQVFVSEPEGADYNIHLPQDFVREFASHRNIPYLDLLPVLREYARSGNPNPYIVGDAHFNDIGHRVVGEHLAAWFLAEPGEKGSGRIPQAAK